METILNLLLIRFALVAAGVVALALLLFAIALAVRRRGGTGEVRRYATPVARMVLQHMDDRDGPAGRFGRSRRRALARTALVAAAHHLADAPNGARRSGE